MAAESSHTMLVALQITDQEGYRRYRQGMRPILTRYGGRFGYDLVVSEVLRAEVSAPINRVFTIVFPGPEACAAFFADPGYLAVRREHFEPSVGHTTIIAEY